MPCEYVYFHTFGIVQFREGRILIKLFSILKKHDFRKVSHSALAELPTWTSCVTENLAWKFHN